MTSDPLISVVIVTWNGRQYLEACLTAVAAQEGVSAETILVDNASTDGTVALRARAISVGTGRRADREPRIRRRQQRGCARGPRRDSSRCSTTTPCRSRAGCRRSSAASMSGRASRSSTSRIVYMHDPRVIDSAGDGLLRWGGAFKRHHGASVESRASPAKSSACAAPPA